MKNGRERDRARKEWVAGEARRQKQDAEAGSQGEPPSMRNGLGKRVIIYFGGFVFLAAGVFIFVNESLPALMLRIGGTASQGDVDRLVESQPHQYGESKNHVYYSFALPSGETIEGHTQISGSQWSSLRVGQTVKVLYLPNNPRHNCLADYRLWEIGIVLMIVFPPLFGGIEVFLLLNAIRPQLVQHLFHKFAKEKVIS